jgi:hypothetical protein
MVQGGAGTSHGPTRNERSHAELGVGGRVGHWHQRTTDSDMAQVHTAGTLGVGVAIGVSVAVVSVAVVTIVVTISIVRWWWWRWRAAEIKQ